MTSAEFECLQSDFISVNSLINKDLYEEALDKLYILEKEATKFPHSRMTSDIRSYIVYCLIKLDRISEALFEKKLLAEETERLGDFDESGDIYKEIGDMLKVGGKIEKSRIYYLLAKNSYETYVSTNSSVEPSPPEAWLAWSLVCKGEAINVLGQKAAAYIDASHKFGEAKEARKDNKMLSSFYESRNFFLMGRASLIIAVESICDVQNLKICEARYFFGQAAKADINWKLAIACEDIVSALLFYDSRKKETIQLMSKAKTNLGEIEKIVYSEKLCELIDNYLNGTVKDVTSFCIAFEQSLIL